MWATFVNAWRNKEIRNKILFTLMVILIYRFGAVAVLVPNINTDGLRTLFDTYTSEGNLLGYFNVLTGGALSYATLFALSITPYINAQIIIQLLTVAIPALERMQKEEGEDGRKKLASITRYSAILIGFIQSFTYYLLLKNQSLLESTTFWSATVIVISFTAGSAICMWLGEQITDRGIGNGISMLLFASILSRIPQMVSYFVAYIKEGGWYITLMAAVIVIMLAMIVFIVIVTDAERRVPVQYAKRMVGRKMYGGQSQNLPMKVNMSGVLPIIFASTFLMLPGTIINFCNPAEGTFWYKVGGLFSTSSWFYIIFYFLLIFGFSYFYSIIQFNPIEVANNLKKNGGFVMGYRPGKPTSDYLQKILSKVTFIGAVFLVIVALFPVLFGKFTGVTAITIGGTSLLIAVGVALETYKQLEAQLLMRHYKGFLE